jgi:hypothetical protein
LDILNRFIEEQKLSIESSSAEGKTWRDLCPVMTSMELKHMLSLLTPDATLTFGRIFEIDDGVKLPAKWVLGMFLKGRDGGYTE